MAASLVPVLAHAQIDEDYTAGDPSGWTPIVADIGQLDPVDPRRSLDGNIEVSTWQIGRIIDGTEAEARPDPISGGNGPTVLTYDIRQPIAPGTNWDVFQKASRDFSFNKDQFDTHVVWLEFSTFSNWARASTELSSFTLNLLDDLGVGPRLINNWNTKNAVGTNGTRANSTKPRRAYLATDDQGEIAIDPESQLPVVRDVLDGNRPGTQQVAVNLNYQTLPPSLLFGSGIEVEDADGSPLDGSGPEDQPVLNTLFEQQAVVRLNEYRDFRYEVEWRALNPDASGDGNWRSLVSEGLGSGTKLDDPSNQNSLVVTETIGDIRSLELSATRRDVGGDEGGILPSVLRANPKINTNQSSTNGAPDEADANHQIGVGRFVAHVYHAGDLNRDGRVSVADLVESDLLPNLGATKVEDASISIGSPQRDVSWVDGDTVNTGEVTVADAMAGLLTGLAGPLPTGPRLIYTPATGALSIDTEGQSVAGFSLLSSRDQSFNLSGYNDPTSGSAISTVKARELSWMNLTDEGVVAGSNLTGTIDLGAVLPTGLTEQEFEAAFAAAVFNVGNPLTRAASFFAEPGLPGDYNGDGVVDAADYSIWRDGLGSGFEAGDYDVWAGNYGATDASASRQIPEPGALGLSVVALLTCRGLRDRLDRS